MRTRPVLILFIFAVALMTARCAEKNAYFGVPNRSLTVPDAFPETEKAISGAERSPGAAYCPERIEESKKLAREGVEIYWACRDAEAMDRLARARALAEEATRCQPPPPPPPPAPPPKPAPPPPAPVVRIPEAVVITNAFKFDSLAIDPKAYRILDQQAEVLRNSPELRVQIIGHTDSVGTEAYNSALGERRALFAKSYLEEKGIASQRIETLSAGESRPIATNDTEAGRAMNRRVELKFVR